MTRCPLAAIALACALFGATQARADDMSFSGFADGYQTVNIALSAPNAPLSEAASAGGLLATLGGGASFTAYCADLYEPVGFGTTYPEYNVVAGASHSFANSNANVDIGKLYAEGNLVNDATTQAAFQIAIWEIAYETSGSYDLSMGSAQFTGGTADSSGALALAGAWLNALASTTNTSFTVTTYESAGHQDMVSAVPEPATYALTAAGLLCVVFLLRRRGRLRD